MAPTPIYSVINEEFTQEAAVSRGGCCFWMPCMHCDRLRVSVESNWWREISEDGSVDRHRCWSKGLLPLKKIKEWSELVAGPKLMTFIRRFKKNRCKHGRFQYDPTSYLLNFDEGPGHSEDDDRLLRNFHTRYSSSLVSAKSSMDLGEDGPAVK